MVMLSLTVFPIEIARDALHSTGLFKVLEGVISPVNDAYEKKVCNQFVYGGMSHFARLFKCGI